MKNIAIFSVPRSGSTWLGQILNSSPNVLYRFQPNFAYSFEHELSEYSTENDIKGFHRALVNCTDPFVCGLRAISGKTNIQFPKDELLALIWKEVHFIFLARTLLENSETKVIGLVRSPLAVIASWLNTPKEFNSEWNVNDQWKEAKLKNLGLKSHYFGYEKWKEALFLFEYLQNRFPERFLLLNYDSLLNEKLKVIQQVFSFCGLPFRQQTFDFVQQTSFSDQTDPYSVFRIKNDDSGWKSILPQSIKEEILNDQEFIDYNERYRWV